MKRFPTQASVLLCCVIAIVAYAGEPQPAGSAPQSVPPELIRFHGHECPGVTIGYRMAQEAMKAVPADGKLAAIVENRTCGVDALQWVTGCTAGKSNLIFKDYGKQAYTLYSTETKKGVRIVFDGQKVPEEVRKDKAAFIKWLMTTDASAFLTIKPVEVNEPVAERTKESAPCSVCSESVSLTYLREVAGKKMCVPCSEKDASAGK